MKEYRIIRTKESYEDLRCIFRYISINLWNHQAANSLHKKIKRKIDDLKFSPKKYQLIESDDPRLAGLRVVHVDNFKIYYQVFDEKNCVIIYRILYSGVDLNSIAIER